MKQKFHLYVALFAQIFFKCARNVSQNVSSAWNSRNDLFPPPPHKSHPFRGMRLVTDWLFGKRYGQSADSKAHNSFVNPPRAFISRAVSAVINPDDSMECFVAERLQRSSVRIPWRREREPSCAPPPSRGVIKFILANSCRVTCSNSRGTWPGAITSPCRQLGQVRTNSRRYALRTIIFKFRRLKGLYSWHSNKRLTFVVL